VGAAWRGCLWGGGARWGWRWRGGGSGGGGGGGGRQVAFFKQRTSCPFLASSPAARKAAGPAPTTSISALVSRSKNYPPLGVQVVHRIALLIVRSRIGLCSAPNTHEPSTQFLHGQNTRAAGTKRFDSRIVRAVLLNSRVNFLDEFWNINVVGQACVKARRSHQAARGPPASCASAVAKPRPRLLLPPLLPFHSRDTKHGDS